MSQQTPFITLGLNGKIGPGKQGARAIGPISYKWTNTAGQSFSENFALGQSTQSLLDSAQTVFVDNSGVTGASNVVITFSSGQRIAIPESSQAILTVLCTNPLEYTISTPVGLTGTTFLFFLNFPASNLVWNV